MSTLAAHDLLLPQRPGGNGAGMALAVAVHLGLLAALTFSVDWRSQPADVVSAELWAAVPQVAAPRAEAPAPSPAPVPVPTPAPPPPAPAPPPQVKPAEPDIALEREQRRRKLEEDTKKRAAEQAEDAKKRAADKAEADKKKREHDAREAREAKAEEQRLAEQREANLKRIMGEAGSTGGRSGGTASQDAAPSASYAGKVRALIRNASVFTGNVPGNPAAEVEVSTGPSGLIMSKRLVKSSGFKAWDDAVLQAIDKVGTLPRDSDGRVPSKIIISFQPNER